MTYLIVSLAGRRFHARYCVRGADSYFWVLIHILQLHIMLELLNPIWDFGVVVCAATSGSLLAMAGYDHVKRMSEKKRTRRLLSSVFAYSEFIIKQRLDSIRKINNEESWKLNQLSVDLSIYAIEFEPFVSLNLESSKMLDTLKQDEISIIYEISSGIKQFNKAISPIYDMLPNKNAKDALIDTRYLSLFEFWYDKLSKQFDMLEQIKWYDRAKKTQLHPYFLKPFQDPEIWPKGES